MLVSIKLNVVPSFLQSMVDDQNSWSGDQTHCGFNPDQSIALEGDVLTFSGQRCPFAQDGSLAIFRQALGDAAPESAEVVAYESSDSRLRWWETLDSYMATRASEEELLVHLESGRNKYWESSSISQMVTMWPRLSGLARKAELLKKYPMRFNAEFGADERQNVRRLLKLVS